MPILNFNLDHAAIVDHLRMLSSWGAMVSVHKNAYFRM